MKETRLQLLLDPYTQKIEKNADFNRTTQNVDTFSGKLLFPNNVLTAR